MPEPEINLNVASTGQEYRKLATGSQRDGSAGKGRYDLISPLALFRLAARLEGGMSKYGARNWELGQPMSWFMDSAFRHMNNYLEGKRDEDHLGAAFWNLHCALHTEEMVSRGLLPKELYDLPDYTAK